MSHMAFAFVLVLALAFFSYNAQRLVRYLQLRYGITNADVIGHATANDSPYFRDYTGIKNAAGDWYAAEVKAFRSRL